MKEEIFDVVDSNDVVIDQKPRSQVHRMKLNHRAVHVLVYNVAGQVFLQKRSMLKDCFPGAWDSSSSGHLDSGEDYDACAIRELREELGVHPAPPLRRLFKIDACPETGHEFVWVYNCRHEGPFQLQASEIERGAWFEGEVLDKWVQDHPGEFAPSFVLIWQKLQEQSGEDGDP